MKKRKLLLTSLLALPVLVSPLMVNSILKKDSNVSLVDQKQTADTTSSGLVNLETDSTKNGQVSIPSNYFKQNSINTLANNNGPILLFDDAKTFGATDWYGNPAWYIHLGTSDGYYSSYWYTTSSTSTIDFSKAGTKVVDWDYNYETDNLYVLTDTSYLIIVTSKTGVIVSATKIDDTVNKVEIIKFNNTVYLWNSDAPNPSIHTVDSKTGELSKTTTTNSSWNTKYLIGIIPLDVNYSVGVFSDIKVDSSNSNGSVSLQMKFIDDSLVDLNSNVTNNTVSLSSTKGSDIYIASFARTSDFIIFIGNKVYSVSLNKSVMTDSKFTDLLNSSSNPNLNSFSISSNVNSAFIDKNNQIYFKTDNSADFNYISISNQFTKVTISTSGQNTVFTSDNVNDAQVFPVPINNSDKVVSYEYTGYVLSPKDFTGTGFKNSSLLTQRYTSTSRNPAFRIDGTNTSSIPSVIQSSNLTANQTALSGFALDTNNATIIADDITGNAFIRVPYIIRQAWYGDNQIASGYLISKWKYAGVASVTTWATQTNFASIFGSYETNQIDENMLKKQATSIIKVPQSILAQANNNLDINFIIVSRTPNTGKITLNATISYTNSYGSVISYAMTKQQEYTIAKQAAAYSFMFAGAESNFDKINVTSKTTSELYESAQKEIKTSSSSTFFSADVISLGANYTDYANTLPSLWQVEGISKFITKNDKYPSNAVIEVLAADDDIGSIIILVSYNNLSNSTPSKFAIKYTGIVNYSTAQVQFAGNNNTDSLYSQKFSDNNIKILTSVQGFADYNTKLASDVSAGALNSLYTTQLIQYMGFTPKVSIVNRQNNDSEGYSSLDMEYGSICLKLDFTDIESSVLLDSKEEKVVFPKILYNKMGLTNGVIYQRYIGMLPIGETYGITINQERERQLIFANNVNAEFIPSQIRNILDVKGYDVAAGDTINIDGYSWNGEILVFYVSARSKTYESVRIDHKEFQVNWAPKFASVRQTSLIVAVITSLVGITLVALGISLYIVRRNKIRKLLK